MNQFLNKNKVSIILFIILILHSVISISYFSGIYGSDDWLYARTAIEVSQGDFKALDSFGGNRIGLIFPTALFMKIFGINEFAITLYPFLLSLLTIVIVFKIGKTLFDEKIGVLSAFIIATIPLQITQTTQLMPNLSLTFWLTFSIFLCIYPIKKMQKYKHFFIGIIIGIAYLHHITAGYMLIFMAIYTSIKQKSLKPGLYVISGFLLIFIFESFVFYQIGISNKLLNLFSKYANTRSKYLPDEFTFSNNTFKMLNHIFNPFWMTSFSIIPITTILLNFYSKKKIKTHFNIGNYNLIIAWIFSLLCLYLYFPNGLQFKPMTRVLTRYYSPVLPPLAILSALGIYSTFYKKIKVLYIVIFIILTTSLFFIQVSENNRQLGRTRRQIIQKSIKYVEKYNPDNIYCERKNIDQYKFHLYNKTYKLKKICEYYPNFQDKSIIVYDTHRISSWHKEIYQNFPNYLKSNKNYQLLETVKIKKNVLWKIMDKIKPDGSDPDYYIGGYILYIK